MQNNLGGFIDNLRIKTIKNGNCIKKYNFGKEYFDVGVKRNKKDSLKH